MRHTRRLTHTGSVGGSFGRLLWFLSADGDLDDAVVTPVRDEDVCAEHDDVPGLVQLAWAVPRAETAGDDDPAGGAVGKSEDSSVCGVADEADRIRAGNALRLVPTLRSSVIWSTFFSGY